MSQERSFEYMDMDELFAISLYDGYKVKLLQDNQILSHVSKWGIGGLDEASYVAMHRIGDVFLEDFASSRLSHLEKQTQTAQAEIDSRPDENPSEHVQYLVDCGVNPASMFTFRDLRKKLRYERIKKMRDQEGVKLRAATEVFAYTVQSISEAVDSVSAFGGKLGEGIRNNLITIGLVGSFSVAAVTGYRWVEQDAVYQPIAQEYRESHQVGPSAYTLKRTIPELDTSVTIDLIHTDKIKFKLDDTEITIPETFSHPQIARVTIAKMGGILNESLGEDRLYRLDTVSESDKRRLSALRGKAEGKFETAGTLLMLQTDNTKSYTTESLVVSSGTSLCENAASILETYMDSGIIKEEDSAYGELQMWKYLTYGFSGLGGLLLFNLMRNSRKRRQYGRYY